MKGPDFIALHELFASAARLTSLKPYPEDIAEGTAHVGALSAALADFGAKVREDIDSTGRYGDAGTADLLTGISRDVDKHLWLLEAHLQAER